MTTLNIVDNDDDLLVKLLCAMSYKDYDDLYYLHIGDNLIHSIIITMMEQSENKKTPYLVMYKDYNINMNIKNKLNAFFTKISKTNVTEQEINNFIKLLIVALYDLKKFFININLPIERKKIKDLEEITRQLALEHRKKDNYIKELKNTIQSHEIGNIEKDNYIESIKIKYVNKHKELLQKYINNEKLLREQDTKITALEASNILLKESITALTANNDTLKNNFNKLITEKNKLNCEYTNLKNTSDKMIFNIEELIKKNDGLLLSNVEIDELLKNNINKYKILTKEFNDYKTTSNNKIQKIQNEMEKHEKNSIALSDELKNKNKQNNEISEKYKLNINTLETKISDLQKLIITKNNDIQTHKTKLKEFELNIITLNETIEKMNNKTKELEKIIIDKDEIKEINFMNEDIEKELNLKIDTLNKTIITQSNTITELNEKINIYETQQKPQQIINMSQGIFHKKTQSIKNVPITYFDKIPYDTLTTEQLIDKLNCIEKKYTKLEEVNFYFETIIAQQQITCQNLYQQQQYIYQQQVSYQY